MSGKLVPRNVLTLGRNGTSVLPMTTTRTEAEVLADDTARYQARIAGAYARAAAREATESPAPTAKLTAAAQRDLALLRAGKPVDLRYGPFHQLLAAGFIEGTQSDYRLASS